MKINNSNPSTVPFSSLEVGGVFEYRDGYISVKIPEITDKESSLMPTYNTYNLTTNSYLYLYNDYPVLPYPNATLNLN